MARSDGYRVKNVDMMYTIVPYIMPRRSDACNAVTVHIPLEPLRQYIHRRRDEGFHTSYMYLVLAAYVRAIAKYPAINRFVANKRIYARRGIWVGMVVQRPGNAEGTMGKFSFEAGDTIGDVTKKLNDFVGNNRQEDANATDALMRKLTAIPSILNVGVGIFKLMDKCGILPRSIINASPFHCSMVISNLASIRTNHIHHHIYDFGTVGSIITMGNMVDIPVQRASGITLEKNIPLGIVCDERVCSGYYYAKVFAEIRRLLAHPELLETPPETVVLDA